MQPSLIRPKLREKQLPEGTADTRSIRPRPLLDGRGLLEAPRAIPGSKSFLQGKLEGWIQDKGGDQGSQLPKAEVTMATKALANALAKSVRELRIHFCQTSEASAGTRCVV